MSCPLNRLDSAALQVHSGTLPLCSLGLQVLDSAASARFCSSTAAFTVHSAAEIEAIRKATATKVNALKSSERRLRALDIRDQKKRENHAKILVGVAMIHQCQISEASANKFKAMLEEFYADSPDRLKNALYGLGLTVKKPSSDLEQD